MTSRHQGSYTYAAAQPRRNLSRAVVRLAPIDDCEAMLASNANSAEFGAAATPSAEVPRSLIDGPLGYGLAAAALLLWQFGRLDHGPLGMALRGDLATFCLAMTALGLLSYAVLSGLRHRHRPFQATLTVAVLVLLSAGYAFGCAEQLHDAGIWPGSTAVAAPLSTPLAGAKYPAAVRQHFMNSCITSGGTQSTCACAIDGIEAKYALKDFEALDGRAQAGEKMPADLVRIVSGCNAGGTISH